MTQGCHRRLRALAALSAIAIAAGACGSDSTKTGGQQSSTTASASSANGGFPALTTPQKGGRLRVALLQNNDCWNGLSYIVQSWSMFAWIARGLYGYPNTITSPDNDTVEPELAAAMPEVSKDGLTYTIKLRKGLTFPDGSAVDSDDVKATFEYMLDPNIQCATGGPPASGYYSVIDGADAFMAELKKNPKADAHIAGIKTVDPLTTQFTLTSADGAFLRALAMEWSFVRPSETPHKITDMPPIFVGPYKVSKYDLDKQLTVDREPTWPDNVAAGVPAPADENNLDGLDLTIGMSAETQLQRIKDNTLDLSFTPDAPTGSDVPAVANDPRYKDRFFSTPDPSVTFLALRSDKAPFDDVKVRQATNYAINRDAVVKVAGGKLANSAWSEILSANLMVGSADPQGTLYGYDPKKAKDLLAASGADLPVKITLVHSSAPAAQHIATAIKENLDAAGFSVTLKGLSDDVLYGYLADPKSPFHTALTGWSEDYADAITYFGPLLTCPDGEPTGSNNGRFCNAAFDDEVARINRMAPGEERTKAFAQLSIDTMRDLAPQANVMHRRQVSFVSNRVGNYIYGNGQHYFAKYFIKRS